jgi:hypothetical protein
MSCNASGGQRLWGAQAACLLSSAACRRFLFGKLPKSTG